MFASIEFELIFEVRPTDDDHDGLPDTWETSVGLDPTNPADAAQDSDNDGLDNLGEYTNQTQPFNADSDGDLIPDGFEVLHAAILDPNFPGDAELDSDGDYFTNLEEYLVGTDPQNRNSAPFNLAALIVILSLKSFR